ncbi:MAG: response regulator [Acidaminococcaceae bacterium]|jgi:response regulator NasT|nr:response regulator [Acidaminococcaceae bacterium]MCI2109630.1 response regulator [Acidaminococcaceae bacterium]
MKKLNILIVDDEALIRMDVKEMLTEAGHTVIGEGASGEDAIQLTRKLHPDFIIMDVKMPGMGGIAAAKTIIEEGIAPVLLLTAYSQTDIVEQANDAGVLAYLVKPIREEQLFPAIDVAYERFKEMQGLNKELENLKSSLETRKLLDRAKGIIMDTYKLNEKDAYRKMQKYCMNKRITMKQLAESILSATNK